jgi:hypothetical protein
MHVGSVALVVLVVLGVVLANHSSPRRHTTTTGFDTSQHWPARVALTAWTHSAQYQQPRAYGSLAPTDQLKIFGGVRSVAPLGSTTWALGALDGAQYALYSVDRGHSWRVGGGWLYLAGAGFANFSQEVIEPLSARELVTFAPGSQVVDVSFDAGRQWFYSIFVARVVSLTHVRGPRGALTLRLTVRSDLNSSTRSYELTDGATNWTLSSAH